MNLAKIVLTFNLAKFPFTNPYPLDFFFFFFFFGGGGGGLGGGLKVNVTPL